MGKLKPESSLRDRVLSGGRRSRVRPAVRRFSLAGAACLCVLAVAILLPELLRVAVVQPQSPDAQAAGTPSLSIAGSGESEGTNVESPVSSLLAAVINGSGDVLAVSAVQVDRQEQVVRSACVDPSCVVEDTASGTAIPLLDLFREGGAQGLEAAVEELLGVELDGALIFTNGDLASCIDAGGGVEVFLLPQEAEMINSYSGSSLQSGEQRLTGEEALCFLQMDDGDMSSLTGRGGRQSALAESLWMQADPDLLETLLLESTLFSSLPELPDAGGIAEVLSFSFESVSLPENWDAVDSVTTDENGARLILLAPTALREQIRSFFRDDGGDQASSDSLPPYYAEGASTLYDTVNQAMIDLCGLAEQSESETVIPAVHFFAKEPADQEGGVEVVCAGYAARFALQWETGVCGFQMEGGQLVLQEAQAAAARLLLTQQEDGAWELAAVEEAIYGGDPAFSDADGLLGLSGGDEVLAAEIAAWDGGDGTDMLAQTLDESIRSYWEQNDLEPFVSWYLGPYLLPIPLRDEVSFEELWELPEGTQLSLSPSCPISSALFPVENTTELLDLIRVGTVNVSEGWMPYFDSGVPVLFLTDADGTLLHWLAFPGEDGAFWLDGVRLCQMDGASWELFRALSLSA